MSDDKTIQLERFNNLEKDELESRLEQEESYLSQYSPSEQLYLLHELRVYQIELEMQNRELHDMRAELEAARDRYANLYDFAPVGYLTVDEHGVIEQINITGARLLGMEPAAIVGYPLTGFLEQGEKSRFLDYLRRVAEAAGEALVEEFRLRAKQGTFIEAALKSILIQELESGHWVCRTAVLDLTRQRRAEAEAQANRDALAHATRVNKVGEMASGVVHELSQPLSAITTYSGILDGLLHGEGSKQDMICIAEKIGDQAERSIALLQQIRDFARSRPFEKSYHSVAKLVDDALGLIGNKLRHSGIRVVVVAERALPEVFVDPIQVTQVLINLLSNAVDIQRQHDIRGRIVIRAHPAGNQMEIRVVDNGPGVDPAMAQQLFMPFKTSKPAGLGIGLSLSRSIIEAHHGRIWVDPNVDTGAAFCFTLPLQQEELDE